MVYCVYVEKKPAFASDAAALKSEIQEILGISAVTDVRIVNRYYVENIDEALFADCREKVFAEPQTDDAADQLDAKGGSVFAVEYLPGQFDQRADSAAQCIQLVSGGERPLVASAKVYILYGSFTEQELAAVKKYVINPVESREAALSLPASLKTVYEAPADVAVMDGFLEMDEAGKAAFIQDYGLAMDAGDLECCLQYFREEGRCPSLTEIRVLDTYWSDHCRHTTFSTVIDKAEIEDAKVKETYDAYMDMRTELGRTKPVTLMDMGTIGAKYLRAKGVLTTLDESPEVNACTVKTKVDVNGEQEDWLFLFKNETHNHPTEIEPFGGAATCVGGAIRDPLSGRSYVYQAMRLTGAGDPTLPVSETLPGKLHQRTIVTSAAAGYSSYGNQIGLATGLVDELYHPGYVAKRMEVGAVCGAAPSENVKRLEPQPGDQVILLGGRTGRDGCGGATGSSKSHSASSLATCGAEVQKGNAPEERKLQRLFRNERAAKMIKRCNDFGAGGVSVAIGELADGMRIDLDQVTKKYEGLDGTELAISESQERMAVVLDRKDTAEFLRIAESENLEARIVAEITAEPRMVMHWRGKTIVNLSRAFLDSNGAAKHISVHAEPGADYTRTVPYTNLEDSFKALAGDLNVCSKRGLAERFDSTIGAATVLMPFGGKRQRTPAQAMAAKFPVLDGDTQTCSVMAYGFDPYISEKDRFDGGYLAVLSSVAKVTAAGGSLTQCYLSFQEYFEKLGADSSRWGKPFASLLGALKAQKALATAAIGGKDSMSGTFENIHVPPTLISFAASVSKVPQIVSPEFKKAGSTVVLVVPDKDSWGLPDSGVIRGVYESVSGLLHEKKAVSAWTPVSGGVAEGIFKMCIGNGIGFRFAEDYDVKGAFGCEYGAFVLELAQGEAVPTVDGASVTVVGETCSEYALLWKQERASLTVIEKVYEDRLESVFACNIHQGTETIPTLSYKTRGTAHCGVKLGLAKPKVLIPVFPGTNCEYDTARAFERAGAEASIVIIRNLQPQGLTETIEKLRAEIDSSQIILLPGGFSGGDEPDGSGKFITAIFRNPVLTEAVRNLLQKRDGLMGGICNGFQALIKLGLVPFGDIIETDDMCPTLTFNKIGRHQSRLVDTRIASVKSPWLAACSVGDVYPMAISHGEGRFICGEALLKQLADNGQIASQYVDAAGKPTTDVQFNPNGSAWAVEGITSPDGRVFGKMGHAERMYADLYKNVCETAGNGMFASAVSYFK